MNTNDKIVKIIEHYLHTISSSKTLKGTIKSIYNMTPKEIDDLFIILFEIEHNIL